MTSEQGQLMPLLRVRCWPCFAVWLDTPEAFRRRPRCPFCGSHRVRAYG